MRKLLASVALLAVLSTPVYAQPALQSVPAVTLCGVLKGANMNITTDQAITITPPVSYVCPLCGARIQPQHFAHDCCWRDLHGGV
jgi:hypothetical protein